MDEREMGLGSEAELAVEAILTTEDAVETITIAEVIEEVIEDVIDEVAERRASKDGTQAAAGAASPTPGGAAQSPTGLDSGIVAPPAGTAEEDSTGQPGGSGRKNKKKKKRKLLLWRHKNVNKGKESFASGLNGYKIIWVFILGCIIGVVFETLYVYFMDGVWMRRSGMLYGPFNQIYGLGAVLFTLLLYRFRKKNAFLIFLVSAVVGAAFEYASSWVQQVVFGSVSWEYSDMPANIGGRTNLFYAAGWGFMGLMFITHFWPFLSEMIERIPNKLIFKGKKSGNVLVVTGKTLTIVCAVALALNLLLSGAAVFRAGRRSEGIPATNVVDTWLDEHYPNEVMAKKYPSMEFVDRFGTDNSGVKSGKDDSSNAAPSDKTGADGSDTNDSGNTGSSNNAGG